MTIIELQALSPFLTLTAVILATLMIIAFARNHLTVIVTTGIGLVLTLASITCVVDIIS